MFKKRFLKLFILFTISTLILGGLFVIFPEPKPAQAATVTLYPSASGTYSAWSRSGCAANWDCVNETPHDGDTTYVSTSTNNARDSYNLQDNQIPTNATVTSIQIIATARRTTTNTTRMEVFYRLGGTNYDGATNFSLTSSYAEYSETWSGLSLSLTDLNNLEIGVLSTNNRDKRVTQLRVVITYFLPPNTPSNTSPADGATGVSRNPTLTSSAFSDPDPGDTHSASEWQITNQSGNYSAGNPGLVWDSGVTATNLTSIVVNDTNGTFQGALAGQTQLAECTTYYWHVRHRDNHNLWSDYSQETSFTTACPAPDAAFYLNSSEPSLTDGGRVFHTIDVFGTNFGSGPCDGVNNAVKIGTYTVPCASVTTWTNLFIAFNVPAAINVYGGTGTNGLIIRAGGQDDPTPLTFYVYPDITSLTTPQVANAAREYDSGDTDGVITLNGSRFGTGGTVTILGVSATVTNYTDTAVTVQVPQAIADDAYTGSIILTRTTPADNKTDTWSAFRVLPRITSLVPDNGIEGNTVQINGNHFCQTGTCPGVGSRSTATDNVKFYDNVQVPDADVSAWSHTQITVKVPTGASSGNVYVTSNNYLSNGKYFTMNVATPNDPTDLRQFKTDQLTEILVGGGTNETEVRFRMTMSASIPGTLYPQVEVKTVTTPFDGTGIVEGPGVIYSGTPVTGWVAITGLLDGNSYHWRARVRRAPNFYSNWVSFGGNIENPPTNPADTDFYVDTSPPIISNVSSGIPTDTTATITWNTNESANEQVEYSPTSCTTGTTKYPDPASGSGTSHSVTLTNLIPNLLYYYRVHSTDMVGNEAIYPVVTNDPDDCLTFMTAAGRPIKTVNILISQETGETVPGSPPVLTKTFTINIPEDTPSVKSAFIEISGISGVAATQTINLELKRETNPYSGSGADYSFDSSGTITPFTLFFNTLNPPGSGQEDMSNITSPGNYTYTLYLGPKTGGASVYILSAKLILTYSYVP